MKKNRGIRFVVLIFSMAVFLVLPRRALADEMKRVYKENPIKTWITVGETVKLDPTKAKEMFGIKDKTCKVTYYSVPNSRLKVTKNGRVSVKKKDKTCTNYKYDRVNAVILYKGTEYTYCKRFVISYEYDDRHPISGDIDVTPEQVKRFQKAYRTGNVSKLTATEKKIFKQVKKAVNYAKSGKNRYEQCKRLNDWITKRVSYDSSSGKDDVYTIEGPLLYGRAKCNGYMNTFKLCALVMGIPCETVLGHLENNDGEGHSWNIVKLEDGKWYHIDVTFNDTDNTVDTEYSFTTYNDFCLTDEQMWSNGHRWYDSKKCDGKEYNFTYYERNYFVDSEQDKYRAVKQAVEDGKEYAYFYEDFVHGSHYDVEDLLVSMYVGKNITVQTVSKDGDIPIDVAGYVLPESICPNGKEHARRLYKITYLPEETVPTLTFINNDYDFEQLLRAAVERGDSVIKNIAISEEYDESRYYSLELSDELCGKMVRFTCGGGIRVPGFMTPDGKPYVVGDIDVTYEEDEDV